MVQPAQNNFRDLKLRTLSSFLSTWGDMAGVASSVKFKGLSGKYFSIATLDVIGSG